MTDVKPAHPERSFDLLLLLWERRRTILLVTAFGAVVGVAASFLITPRYKSEIILFPAITNTASKALLNEGTSSGADMMMIGEEEDAQHLMQILHSAKVRDRTADRFGLMEAYGIDPEGAHRKAELFEAFKDHVEFEYTRYGTVRVQVMDKDPQRAADMANFMADQVDSVWTEMTRERAQKAYALVKRKTDEEERIVRALEDSLQQLRELGLQDYGAQVDRFNQALAKALASGNARAVKEIDDRLKVVYQYGGLHKRYSDRIGVENWRAGMWRTRLAQVEADLVSEVPHKFLMERAQPSDKKSYPVRWLVTVLSTLAGLFLAFMLITIQEQMRRFRTAHV